MTDPARVAAPLAVALDGANLTDDLGTLTPGDYGDPVGEWACLRMRGVDDAKQARAGVATTPAVLAAADAAARARSAIDTGHVPLPSRCVRPAQGGLSGGAVGRLSRPDP